MGGSSYAIALNGNRAYFDLGTRLLIADIGVPSTPTILGQSEPLNARISDIAVLGDFVYLATGTHLHVFDVSDPALPAPIALVDARGDALFVTIADGYAYVSGGQQVQVFRLDNPALPVWVAAYVSDGLLLSAGKVTVNGTLAYVPGGFNRGLVTLDISDPTHPTAVGGYPATLHYSTNRVQISGNYAYIVGSFNLQVAQLTDPKNPQKIADFRIDSTGIALDVLIDGHTLYLPLDTTGVRILDISNPASPQPLGLLARGLSPPHTLALAGSHLLVASIMGGVRIADVSLPGSPVYTSAFRSIGWARNLAIVDDFIYMAEGGRGLWILESAKINEGLGAAHFIDLENAALDITVSGHHVFIAGGKAGIKILDATDPANPTLVATHDTPGSAWQIAIVGSNAYIADYDGGLRILDISDIARPVEVGSIPPPSASVEVTAVSASANFVFMYAGTELHILSIADNPTAPTQAGIYASGLHLSNVIAEGTTLYLSEGFDTYRLLVLDISNPAKPVEIGSHPLTSSLFGPSVWEVAKEGDRVAVAFGYDGLVVFDVSAPATPKQIGRYSTAWEAAGVVMSGDTVAIGNGDGGLLLLRLADLIDLFLPNLQR
ncbi:MAG: hypothetical protein KBG20_12315 [Caldilineaceae bacterium]|nr:hypothetical protein [Caldilineaceae bacterium]MBP9073083.1 hypothetical protein [Caldilineaceae bacterium]